MWLLIYNHFSELFCGYVKMCRVLTDAILPPEATTSGRAIVLVDSAGVKLMLVYENIYYPSIYTLLL